MYIQSLQPYNIEQQSYLTVLAEKTGNLILKILDPEGHIAKTINTPVTPGMQQLPLNMSDLNAGFYILNIFNGDVFIKAIRFNKQ